MSSRSSFKRPHDGAASEPNKRQKQEGTICPEEAHTCEVPSTGGKKKYYAIWGGPNPGVHHTVWDVARNWAERFSVKQRSFKDADSASHYYQEQKMRFPGLVDMRRQSHGAPQSPVDPRRPQPPRATAPDLDADFIPLKEEGGSLQCQISITPSPGYPAPSSLVSDLAPSRDPPLSPEQVKLVDLIVNKRENVFYTGSAGVGKSRVLKAFRQRLSALGYKVNVVAPTGRAALDINGSTTWSCAGWTPASMKKPLEELLREAWQKTTKRRLQKTDVLVIDEISMVENFHLERLNAIMKEVRQNGKAFGGVEVVITGDFCQLPPVNPFKFCIICGKGLVEISKKSAYECVECDKIYNDEDKWAFQSQAWEEADFVHVNLKTVFRQRDRAFTDILQKLRLGMPLLASDREILCQSKPNIDKAVKLYPRKADVKRINDAEFKKLRTEPRVYHSIDNFEQQNHHGVLQVYNTRAADGTLVKLSEHRYESHLELKQGMLVVLLANISIAEGLVNGSQGTIVGFQNFWDTKADSKSDELITSEIETDLEGDYKGYRARRIFDFMAAESCKQWPIVRFYHKGQARDVIIEANCYPTELGDEPASDPRYSLLSRTQIPLMAAWAMTIHKSQGMTLEKVEVDLSENFEEGMAYVALSRATTLEGLRVISFPENAEMGCNEEVRDFLAKKFNIANGTNDQM
ncbi:ATP-dependent DNA helicase PIF1 [Paraphaeosphaeria minitans]|uniref:ATP-dependent DNA helicase n=1 Tax=Paraphaeosphaeria minitans TaxID=565426 RepID=A0A9P6GK53_9PLEO|nr:ATP-dependent DNA helicase PIF1 [Paraphaeosphaeria minitans]